MATLTVNEIAQDTLEAFKCGLGPIINSWTTDLSSATAKYNETITAHIRSVPSTAAYDASTGFANGAAEAETLLTDVPVTLDVLRHVPIKVDWLTQLASRKNLYAEAVAELGYALAKYVVDAALAKIIATSFSHKTTESTANTSYDTLEAIRTACNDQKMNALGRFGIVSTAFAGALAIDNRVISNQFYGQLNGAQGYRTWQNLAGFKNIWEYPDVPTTGNLTAFFGDRRAFVFAARKLDMNENLMPDLPPVDRTYPVTDPETGLNLTAIAWKAQGTKDVYFTMAILCGLKAGSQTANDGSICDDAGHWVRTAA
jgi:hypothetical protein